MLPLALDWNLTKSFLGKSGAQQMQDRLVGSARNADERCRWLKVWRAGGRARN